MSKFNDSNKKADNPEKTVWSRAKLILHRILVIFCAVVFVISVSYVIISFVGYFKGDNIYGDIADSFYATTDLESEIDEPDTVAPNDTENTADVSEESSDETSSESPDETDAYNAEFEQAKTNLAALKEKYPDLYGWISVENTKIDYPVVQYADNDYYLNRAPDGTYLPAGSIFCDYRCSTTILENYNTVIYGHRMSNGSMFGGVKNFEDEQFFKDNKYIKVSTPDGIYTYLVFSIYLTDMYYRYIQTDFDTPEDFVEFAKIMQKNSKYHREGVEFDENSRILTLSTCKGGFNNKLRYALHAVLVDISN